MSDSLHLIKQEMKNKIGVHVTLRARVGRRGAYVRDGVIDGLYPEVFTVLVDENGYSRRYCFCYSEILTHHVEIAQDSQPLRFPDPKT